jgi:hypothetical protein
MMVKSGPGLPRKYYSKKLLGSSAEQLRGHVPGRAAYLGL